MLIIEHDGDVLQFSLNELQQLQEMLYNFKHRLECSAKMYDNLRMRLSYSQSGKRLQQLQQESKQQRHMHYNLYGIVPGQQSQSLIFTKSKLIQPSWSLTMLHGQLNYL